MTRDFTHRIYEKLLLALKRNGYTFHRFIDYAEGTNLGNLHVILRHDVDRFPTRALKLAKLENKHNIVSSYFFRIKRVSFNTEIINQIKRLGHEIGYHYEDLCDTNGNYDLAWQRFQKNKKIFDLFGGVKCIAMHGRPFSKWNNQDLWKHFDYHENGILLDAYLDINWNDYIYLTDTGRAWNNTENRRDRVQTSINKNTGLNTTKDLLSFLTSYRGKIVISSHPERWTDNSIQWFFCLIQDTLVNQIKKLIKLFPDY